LFYHDFASSKLYSYLIIECPQEAFQCNDGTCLARGSVCNGKWECPDGSDEARCYKGIPNVAIISDFGL
jgi:hypothetical protein